MKIRTYASAAIALLASVYFVNAQDSNRPEMEKLLDGFSGEIKQRLIRPFTVGDIKTQPDGSFNGYIDWKRLKSVHKIEGRLEGDKLTFKEVVIFKKGDAPLGCEYTLKKGPDGKYTGKFEACDTRRDKSGTVKVELDPIVVKEPTKEEVAAAAIFQNDSDAAIVQLARSYVFSLPCTGLSVNERRLAAYLQSKGHSSQTVIETQAYKKLTSLWESDLNKTGRQGLCMKIEMHFLSTKDSAKKEIVYKDRSQPTRDILDLVSPY